MRMRAPSSLSLLSGVSSSLLRCTPEPTWPGTAAWADVGVLASGTGGRGERTVLALALAPALACHRPRPRRRLTQLGGTAFEQANRRPPSPAQLMQASMQASMQAQGFGLIYITDRHAALYFALSCNVLPPVSK